MATDFTYADDFIYGLGGEQIRDNVASWYEATQRMSLIAHNAVSHIQVRSRKSHRFDLLGLFMLLTPIERCPEAVKVIDEETRSLDRCPRQQTPPSYTPIFTCMVYAFI